MEPCAPPPAKGEDTHRRRPAPPPPQLRSRGHPWLLLSLLGLFVFLFFQFTSLSQRNAFLVRKVLKSGSDLLKTRKATSFILAGQACRLHVANKINKALVLKCYRQLCNSRLQPISTSSERLIQTTIASTLNTEITTQGRVIRRATASH